MIHIQNGYKIDRNQGRGNEVEVEEVKEEEEVIEVEEKEEAEENICYKYNGNTNGK